MRISKALSEGAIGPPQASTQLDGRQGSTILYRKLNALTRAAMAYFLSGPLSLYVVNEYPKSGGTWAGQLLGRALNVPFPRNRFPVPRSSIMHSHYLHPTGLKNVTLVLRDGRDVMVSWYYHCLFTNELENAPLVRKVRQEVPFQDYEDIYKNLPEFIEYCFSRQRHPGFSWAEFVRRWHGRKGVVYVKYENLRANTAEELQKVVLELTGDRLVIEEAQAIAEEFSFARQAGRAPGEEGKGQWMRKGVVGDWRNHFSPEARQIFDHYAGDELILLGYETDHGWVNEENQGFRVDK